jgi:glucose-1-phosphate cytidylyltransferase
MRDVTAVILCGGKGERLRPFTETMPKSLLPLAGKPILEHLIRYLELGGIGKFVLCVGYKSECIRDFLAGFESASTITCVDSGDASMTDRILDALPHVTGQALICYGDTLANISVSALFETHLGSGAGATITVYPMYSPFGVIDVADSGLVESFREKPRLPFWINIGYLLCEPTALQRIARSSDLPTFLETLRQDAQLFSFQHTGRHVTVNTEKERQSAEAELVEFFTVLDT